MEVRHTPISSTTFTSTRSGFCSDAHTLTSPGAISSPKDKPTGESKYRYDVNLKECYQAVHEDILGQRIIESFHDCDMFVVRSVNVLF